MTDRPVYKDYFNIKSKYHAVVTQDLIDKGEVDWKSFYPHETFLKLLSTTYKVLTRQLDKSIWVEGAYGTGKSHAALTVKSLLTASAEDIRGYFDEYKLNPELRENYVWLATKSNILTIHRIGSASIEDDMDLIIAVQESILDALRAKGLDNQGEASMKEAFLQWVSNSVNHQYFDNMLSSDVRCSLVFTTGTTVNNILERLNNGTDKEIETTMRGVMKVLKIMGINSIIRDVNQMPGWIESIIKKNHLDAILFIWDEFSEYFMNHPVGLTGFQTLAEISHSNPFYFMIVAHESQILFKDTLTANKTLDRFVKPTIKIDLPDNMAFRLMADAMKVTDDPVLSQEWINYKNSLNTRLINVRNTIKYISNKQHQNSLKTAFKDEDLQDIVPIHPYAALVLKNIAVLFNSNQRSMFDFIVSADNEEIKGFKWFISHYGPKDQDCKLLTVDMLWDFFYGNAQPGLNDDVRSLLDNYSMLQGEKLLPEERRVLKTVLLLEAISLRVTGNELLIPDEQNVDLAFVQSGNKWIPGKANQVAKGLIDKKILFKKPSINGQSEYCVVNVGASNDIDVKREEIIKETTTEQLITNPNVDIYEAINIPIQVQPRYIVKFATVNTFGTIVQNFKVENKPNRFKLIITFSRDDDENKQLEQKILRQVNSSNNDIIFVQILTTVGKTQLENYIENMTFSRYYAGKNDDQSRYYGHQAELVLHQWKAAIEEGSFNLYTLQGKRAERQSNITDLNNSLIYIDRQLYKYGPEQYKVNGLLYRFHQPEIGAKEAIEQKITARGFSVKNKKISIENALTGAWNVANYWKDPAKANLNIVKFKLKVEELIKKEFKKSSKGASVYNIVQELTEPPFGIMPTAISAVVLGFILKEYATADYFWSDGTNSESMSAELMSNAIASSLNHLQKPKDRFKDQYIVTMTPEKRGFLNCTQRAFRIQNVGTIEKARDNIRSAMKGFEFPIWCIKYALKNEKLVSSEDLVSHVIDEYCGIANTANGKSSSESEAADRIGTIVNDNPEVVDDLVMLFNSTETVKGMSAYLELGELPKLAREIGDSGKYMTRIKSKLSADDANWLWNPATVDEKVKDTILDYKIIKESSKTIGSFISIYDVVDEWCKRIDQIRIPYDILAKSTGNLGPFLQQLYYLKQNGLTLDNKKEFYRLLVEQRENFDEFYINQLPYFEKAAGSFLTDVDQKDKTKLFESFPAGQFMKSRTDFYPFVQEKVKDYLRRQWKRKLQDKWDDKTGTRTPFDWSEKYLTPILCMFNNTERPYAKEMLDIINSDDPIEQDAQKAMEWIDNLDFSKLDDQEERDRCFERRIVKDNSILLNDINDVRRELHKTVNVSCYEWMDNSAVQDQIGIMADKEYKLGGCDKALAFVESMDPAELKKYLRERILDDADFGLQFLKHSK